jgi:hypothetical protein
MAKANPYTLTTIQPDGQITHVYLDRKPTLADYYDALGGPDPIIQELPYFKRFRGKICTAYVHEEGLLRGLAVNTPASQLWSAFGTWQGRNPIVGPLVIHTKGHNFTAV